MRTITLLEKIKLIFRQPYYGIDVGAGDDKTIKIKFKRMNGITYILDYKEVE